MGRDLSRTVLCDRKKEIWAICGSSYNSSFRSHAVSPSAMAKPLSIPKWVLGALLLICLLPSPSSAALNFFARHDPAAGQRIAMLARTEAGRAELHGRLSSLVENSAEAAEDQKEQGEGFTIAFVPANSTVYNPDASKTFKVVPHQVSFSSK